MSIEDYYDIDYFGLNKSYDESEELPDSFYRNLKTWTTQDERILEYKDIKDNHLVNIFNMLKRNEKVYPDLLLEELKNRNLLLSEVETIINDRLILDNNLVQEF